MIDISFWEIAVIGVVALVVLGPERLPRVARQAGQWMGKLQRYVADVKSDLNRQMELDELRNLLLGAPDRLDDLTRSILFQIILEEEAGGVPIFSADLLSVFIRIYGNATQGMLGRYLESSMKTFLDFQHRLQDQSRGLYGDNSKQMQADFLAQFLNFQQPAMQSMMTAYMDQSKKMFQQMQDKLQSQTRNMFTGFKAGAVADKLEK